MDHATRVRFIIKKSLFAVPLSDALYSKGRSVSGAVSVSGSKTLSTSSANSRNRGSFIAALMALQALSALSTSRRSDLR